MNAMQNRLLILGEEVSFAECEVVSFDKEGRICEYLLYCDAAAIKNIFARKAAEKES